MRRGERIGPYEIVGEIGAGGMGQLYRARDTRLKREVAIKALAGDLAADRVALGRLRREAELLASIEHPNVATIYGLEEKDGRPYLVMELLRGQTLAQRLLRGPMGIPEAIDVAVGVAVGLEAAHARGVVHRDLKPANVFLLSDGRIKLLDFGIAKAVTPPDDSAATRDAGMTAAGTLVGTIPYMSPEQVRGEPVDTRTDVWALGCLLFEMLAGRSPFARETAADTLSAILEAEPSWSALPAGTPPELERLLRRCVAKPLRERLRDVGDAFLEIEALRTRVAAGSRAVDTGGASRSGSHATPRLPSTMPGPRAAVVATVVAAVGVGVAATLWLSWPGGAPGTDSVPSPEGGRTTVVAEEPSIAVLPLDNLGPPEERYFADGMTEALIGDLAKIDGLKVISRTSVMQFRDRSDLSLPEIAARLGVVHVLVGSVLRSGDRVRITAQLILAAEDRHTWSDSYERELRDILALQVELARAIAAEIRARVTPEEAERIGDVLPVDPTAYEAHLRGKYLLNEALSAFGPETVDRIEAAILQHRRARQLAPGWAPAWAGECEARHFLASLLSGSGPVELDRAAQLYEQAEQLCRRALELDEILLDARASLAYIRLSGYWDWEGAAEEYRRIAELGGADDWGYGLYLRAAGRYEEAIEHFQRARSLSPELPSLDIQLGSTLICSDRFEEAALVARRLIERPEQALLGHVLLAWALARSGRAEEAEGQTRQALALAPDDPLALAAAARVYAYLGDRERAMQLRVRFDAAPATGLANYALPAIVDTDVLLGDPERAVEQMRDHVRRRSSWILNMRCNLDTWNRLARRPEVREIVDAIDFPTG